VEIFSHHRLCNRGLGIDECVIVIIQATAIGVIIIIPAVEWIIETAVIIVVPNTVTIREVPVVQVAPLVTVAHFHAQVAVVIISVIITVSVLFPAIFFGFVLRTQGGIIHIIRGLSCFISRGTASQKQGTECQD
jgi:hypothetical protein